jgi:hypothetical protein
MTPSGDDGREAPIRDLHVKEKLSFRTLGRFRRKHEMAASIDAHWVNQETRPCI